MNSIRNDSMLASISESLHVHLITLESDNLSSLEKLEYLKQRDAP